MSEFGEVATDQTVITKAEKSKEKKPTFVRVTSKDRRTEQEKTEGAVLFRNFGVMDVELNTGGINELLRESGLTPEEISNLEVSFRSGTVADRNFYGKIIGGWRSGKQIELYTTLPTDSGRVVMNYIPIKKKSLAEFLLHETRHYTQEKTGMGTTNTFMAESAEEVEEDYLEQDADRFAESHLEEAQGWIKLKEGLDFGDNIGEDRVTGDLTPFGRFYNLDRRLQVIDPDNPVLYLEQEIDGVIKKEEGVPLGVPFLKELFLKARGLVEKRKLGMAEYNGILDKLAAHFEKEEKTEFKQLALASKYQP